MLIYWMFFVNGFVAKNKLHFRDFFELIDFDFKVRISCGNVLDKKIYFIYLIFLTWFYLLTVL